MTSSDHTGFTLEVLLDIEYEMDRDALIPMRYLSVESNTVAGLEVFDLTHLTLNRFSPEGITIHGVQHVGFLDITRQAYTELVSDIVLTSLARIDHTLHNLDIATHAVQLLPSFDPKKVVILGILVESQAIILHHRI